MNFKQAEERFKQLEAQFAAGKLSETDFKTQLEELMVQDDKGNWWVIGYETKRWYRYNGNDWVEANPRVQWKTYGVIALFVVVFAFGIWGIVSSLSLSTLNGIPGPAGPAGPEGPAGEAATLNTSDLSCAECHNNSGVIPSMQTAWSESLHATGEAYVRGTSADCAGCHSGGGFRAMVAAGQNPGEVETGDPNPTRQDCYTCHQIHTSYTTDDWALETTDPVALIAVDGATYDGGMGNLCANCHQPRTAFPEATDGMVSVTSTHWGGHHGPVDAMLLGVNAAGGVEGKPSPHYQMVENTCVTCHLGSTGPDASHTFVPNVATCQTCHADATDFDINGTQTEIQNKLEQVKVALQGKGLLDDTGTIVVGDYPEAQAAALWNYLFVEEDKSIGVHNANYANAMLDAALEALK